MMPYACAKQQAERANSCIIHEFSRALHAKKDTLFQGGAEDDITRIGVAKLAKKYGAKVIAFAGSVTPDAGACNDAGIDAFFPIIRGVTTLEEAMDPQTATANLEAAAEQVFRLL